MERTELLTKVDYTILKQTTTWEQVKALCDDGIQNRVASICIPPYFVKKAKEYANDQMTICTVIGFPNGYMTTAAKVFETKDAVLNGADEIDMVINIGLVKEGNYDDVLCDIKSVREACRGKLLKVIIETCLLTQEEKEKLCELVTTSGAEFIKTSTGFSTGGATAEDVALLKSNIGPKVKVKASGGIAGIEAATQMVQAGADRLGMSKML